MEVTKLQLILELIGYKGFFLMKNSKNKSTCKDVKPNSCKLVTP